MRPAEALACVLAPSRDGKDKAVLPDSGSVEKIEQDAIRLGQDAWVLHQVVDHDKPPEELSLKGQVWLEMSVSQGAHNPQDSLIVHLNARIQVTDNGTKACLVEVVAKGDQFYEPGQLVGKGPPVVKC